MGYVKEENYCTLSPDRLFGVTFNYGCYLHDRQYRNEVKNRKNRKQADELLRDTMYNKFVVAGMPKRGYIISRIYYYAVRITGWALWTKPKSI